jgi:transcriptional regulator with XRE-family HTH domain
MRKPIGYREAFPNPSTITDPADRREMVETVCTYLLPAQIRIMRTDREWTQQDLADRMGRHVNYIRRLETGHCNITFSTLANLAKAFDCGLMVSLHSFYSMMSTISYPRKISNVPSYETERQDRWEQDRAILERSGHFHGDIATSPVINTSTSLNEPPFKSPSRRGRPRKPTMDASKKSTASSITEAAEIFDADKWTPE